MYGIYAITNLENEKVYFGQSVNIEKRLKGHLNDLLAKRHRNSKLQNAFNKYGKNAFLFSPFRILEKGSDLTYWERKAITEAKELGVETYNIRDPEVKAPLSEETKRKISNSKKGEKCYWFGKKRSEEFKKNHAKFMLGNKYHYGIPSSEETKQKLSEAGKKDWVKRHNLQSQN